LTSVALELVTSDGVRLAAARLPAVADARASVVVVHGFAASITNAGIVALGDAIHDAGYDVLLFDVRGHGRSGGATTLGDKEQFDVGAAVDAVRADNRPIVIVGASMGAIGALRYAASAGTSIAGLVTVSCPARWRLPLNVRGVLAAVLTQTPLGRFVADRQMHVRIAGGFKRPAPPIDLVPKLEVPYAVIHGRADPFINVGDAEALYEAAHDPRRLDLVDGLGHAFEPESIPPIIAALDWVLTLPGKT
jgi:pimeloyl-ACP methyl ester carboxylesterase